VAEYIGSRRASEPLAAMPQAVRADNPFVEDDAMPTCPKCGAGVRPGQEWCTLCLRVLRAPEPPAVPADRPARASTASVDDWTAGPGSELGGVAQVATAPPVPREQVEAAAEALLAQLAVESRGQRLTVPSFLDSNLKIAVAVTAAIATFCFVVVVGLSIVGAVLR
jgi:hypothetical protein